MIWCLWLPMWFSKPSVQAPAPVAPIAAQPADSSAADEERAKVSNQVAADAANSGRRSTMYAGKDVVVNTAGKRRLAAAGELLG